MCIYADSWEDIFTTYEGRLNLVTRIDLSNHKTEVIPPEIVKLENLQELDLSNNKISVIPLEIGKLKNLKNLKQLCF